jgi:hypothetical protein
MSELATYMQMTLDGREGKRRRDEGVAAVEMAQWSDDKALIDRLILMFADGGMEFSSDDVTPYLPPGFRPAAVGSAFLRAAKVPIIEDTGRSKHSERPEARSRKITIWRGLPE